MDGGGRGGRGGLSWFVGTVVFEYFRQAQLVIGLKTDDKLLHGSTEKTTKKVQTTTQLTKHGQD